MKQWRKSKGLTLEDVGDLMGGVSYTAVGRWEKGQDLQGPVILLLRWLIFGEPPFGAGKDTENPLWKTPFSLDEWEELQHRSNIAGFTSVREYLVHLIREDNSTETGKAEPTPENITYLPTTSPESLSRVAEPQPPYGGQPQPKP